MCVCDVYKLNCPTHTHRQWATHTQSERARLSAAVVDFMLAVKLFHLHFVCLPSYHMLGLCHYDDLWAEIIFGPHHLRLGSTRLDVLPACLPAFCGVYEQLASQAFAGCLKACNSLQITISISASVSVSVPLPQTFVAFSTLGCVF